MYTKISIIAIIAVVVLLALILVIVLCLDKGYKRMLSAIIGVSVVTVVILAGTVSAIIAAVKEQTTLSWICLAVFISYFVIVLIMAYRARRRQSGNRR